MEPGSVGIVINARCVKRLTASRDYFCFSRLPVSSAQAVGTVNRGSRPRSGAGCGGKHLDAGRHRIVHDLVAIDPVAGGVHTVDKARLRRLVE